jgi:glycine oxidase
MLADAKKASDWADILIIGGGIIGCAIAYYLGNTGARVFVVEQEEIGAQASSAAAGLLAPLGPLAGAGPFADLLLASFACFPTLVPELEAASGLQLNYVQSGAIRTAGTPKALARLQKRFEAWQPLGLTLHWLNNVEVQHHEPLLSSTIQGAVYAPQEAQISAPSLTQAFALAAKKRGVHIHTLRKIIALQTTQRRVTGVVTEEGEILACKHLVIATGAWSARWEKQLGISLPISPLKGQMLTLRQPDREPLQHIIFGNAIYLAPRPNRLILVGATREESGFESSINQSGTYWLLQTARKLVPALAESEVISQWSGLRPRTPNTRPLLGPAPNWENITIATGHNSVGILLSAITGEMLAQTILTGECSPLLQDFAPRPC